MSKAKFINALLYNDGLEPFEELKIELSFTFDRHHEITFDRNMSANELGRRLVRSGLDLQGLSETDNWNK